VTLSSSTPEPDTTAKGKLAKHLRRIRQSAGLATMPPLARRLGVSPDLISKIETGKHVPTMDIFLAWLDACEVTEEARLYLTEIWALARGAGGIREFFERYAAAEEKATLLRMWGLLVVPGPIQTREYAHAMFLKGRLDDAEAAEQTELRVRRHAKVDGPDPAYATALIYAPVLDCLVGTPEIMIAQLEHLLELSHRNNVVIQVVPNTGYFAGFEGQFEIASGSAIADTVDMVTLEDHVTDDPASADRVIALFEHIRGYALNVVDSRAVITEAIERWKTRQQ
jgi:transcriptional regulator with XRE-family HTH domain